MQAIANFLTGPLFAILRPLGSFLGMMFNPVVGVFLVVYQLIMWVTETLLGFEFYFQNLEFAYNAINEYTFQSLFNAFPPELTELIAFANYIFPVTEALLMLGSLCTIYVIAATIRFAKGLIPVFYGS